jgi:PAS domain S-box-containing protein
VIGNEQAGLNSPTDINIQAEVEAVGRISIVDNLLEVICRSTGMGFAAIARVTENRWIACSVRDEINFGLVPGGELQVETTICHEIRQSGLEVVIDHVEKDEAFCGHPTPALYGFQSYISFPIFRKDGSFFGTLCAIDPKPNRLNTPETIGMFRLFADLISFHLSVSDEFTLTKTRLSEELEKSQLQKHFNKDLTAANEKLAAANNELAEIQGRLKVSVKQLTESKEKLQQAIDTGNMGTWSINPVTYQVTMSDYVKELFGFSLTGEISIAQIVTTIDPDYQQAFKDVLTNAIENELVSDIEYPIINLITKENKWVKATGQLFYHNGELSEYSGMIMDITDQKLEERRQAMLAAIIESSEDAIISKTLNGIITSWNQAAEKLFEHTESEAIGKHITMLIPADRQEEEHLIIQKVSNSERVDHFETIRVTKSGKEIPISLTVSPIRNNRGQVIGASKIVRDISRQKQAEEQLQKYAENLEILNSVGQTIAEDLDIQGILQKVTDSTTQLSGAEFGAFFHNQVNDRGESYMLYTISGVPREAFEKFGMPRNTAVFNPTFTGEGIVRVDDITKDPRYGKNSPHYGMPKGHLPVVSYLAVPVVSKSGSVIGGLFFGHSQPGKFTKEHEQLVAGMAAQASVALDNAKLYAEIKVLNAKKDEFIGLASHELKTPITSINGYLQIIERNLPEGDRNKIFSSKALQQVGKLTTLISDLLDVSKIQTGKLPLSCTTFDLADLLKEVTEMMHHTHASHRLDLIFESDKLMINADQQRIEQVIINLISNAIKYSPLADKVVIRASASGNKVKVAIQDFGIGIEKDQYDCIFSRFYRVENLAAHMSGLGIGLYISHEIIGRHKGRIWLESELGKGSTFYFTLPLAS